MFFLDLFSIFLSIYVVLMNLYSTRKLTIPHFCDQGWAKLGKETALSYWFVDQLCLHAILTTANSLTAQGPELLGICLLAHPPLFHPGLLHLTDK